MNEQVKKALDELSDAIQSAEAYKNYQRLQHIMESQPEKYERLNVFRKAQYEASLLEDGGFEKSEELLSLQQELEKDRECREYLYWETVVCREIRKINDKILELVQVDIPD